MPSGLLESELFTGRSGGKWCSSRKASSIGELLHNSDPKGVPQVRLREVRRAGDSFALEACARLAWARARKLSKR